MSRISQAFRDNANPLSMTSNTKELFKTGKSRVVPMRVGLLFPRTLMVVEIEYYVSNDSSLTVWLRAEPSDLTTETDMVAGTAVGKVLACRDKFLESPTSFKPERDLPSLIEGLAIIANRIGPLSMISRSKVKSVADQTYKLAGAALALAEHLENEISKGYDGE